MAYSMKAESACTTKPWIEKALSEKALYGDGDPNWSNNQSQRDALELRKTLSRFLSKYAFTQSDLRPLSEKIADCSFRNRCFGGACPECTRALQRFFVSESKSLFYKTPACIASIIDTRMSCRENLTQFSANGLINRAKKCLKANGVELAVGGIDFSFNEDRRGRFQPHWCAHLWLILPSRNRRSWESALRGTNPASESAPHPVVVKNWNRHNAALAYALKIEFKRRVTIEKAGSLTRRSQRDSSEQELRVSERIELYRYLDSAGLHARVLLLGARPTMTEHGIRIVKLNQ